MNSILRHVECLMQILIETEIFVQLLLDCAEVFGNFRESESELFTGDTSKDNHSLGPVNRGVSP